VRLGFGPDQLELAGALRQALERECPPSQVRASVAQGWSRRRWRALAELGVTGAGAPPERGGLGLGLAELALLVEECGRAGVPEPVGPSAAVAVPLLARLGDGQAGRWLEAVARGEVVAVVAPAGARLVAGAGRADLVLGAGPSGLVALSPPAGVAELEGSLDPTRPLAEVDWALARPLGAPAGPVGALAGDLGALAAAAEALGVAQRVVEMAAGHARSRHQFGRPVGSFQAVKHLLADALLPLEFARPLVWRAARSLELGDPGAPVHVAMAKAYASRAARVACRAGLQVHGAMGYTWECDLQLWLKRGWSLASQWGDEARHRQRVARALLGPAGARAG
jgi:alkylation response protein AidB-like acyl-CoA dehydrogenase